MGSGDRQSSTRGGRKCKDEDTAKIIDDIFESLEMGFGTERCDRVQRRGKLTAPRGKAIRPRPIVISFIRVSDKSSILRNLKNLNEQGRWKGVSIVDDLTDIQRNQVRDMLALSAYARSKGYNSSVKEN